MLVDGKQMHLGIRPGEIGRYVLVPGDPGRVEKLAEYLDEPHFVARNREFTTYTGALLGETVSICSTGIGGPSTAIAVEELVECGADTLIRVGTCGGIHQKVEGGSLVVATGAVRQDGTSREYMPLEYPAVADFDVTLALRDGAQSAGLRYYTGVVQSKDSFYGQHRPQVMPTGPRLAYQWNAWKTGNVLCSEMEASTLFTVAGVLGVRAGAAFHVLWNQERRAAGLPDSPVMDMTASLLGVMAGLKLLISRDKNPS